MGKESGRLITILGFFLDTKQQGAGRYWLVGVSFVLYIVAYLLFYPTFGSWIAALVLIPLIMTTFLFGTRQAVVLLFLTLPLHGALAATVGRPVLRTLAASTPGYLVTLLIILALGTMRKLYKEGKDKQASLEQEIVKRKQREILLREANHRFKNNLAMIAGLMEMKRMETPDEEIQQVLTESIMRLNSIAKLHDQVSLGKQDGKVNLNESIQQVSRSINNAFSNSKDITLEYDTEDVWLTIKDASTYTLLLNELMANAYKHAFHHHKEGTIRVTLKKEQDRLLFKVEDNGNGLPSGFTVEEQAKESLGMMIILSLARQLDARLSVEGQDGASFTLQKPLH